jgi:signal transduction histidine kinase
MRERLMQLGGTLDIESSDRGTTMRTQIPLPPDAL